MIVPFIPIARWGVQWNGYWPGFTFANEIVYESFGFVKSGLESSPCWFGMQLLFEASDEAEPNARGLGIFAGRVTRLQAHRVPQIGWNAVDGADDALFSRAPLSYAYYANSYVCRPVDESVVHA